MRKIWARALLAVSLVVGGAGMGTVLADTADSASAAVSCPAGTVMNIVGHSDDDLLFLSPDLVHAVQGGWCVRTVVVTAGDAGRGAAYWQNREQGPKAAYAQM